MFKRDKYITTRQLRELLEVERKHGPLGGEVQEIIRRRRSDGGIATKAAESAIETITVPDLPAKALLALAEEQAGLTYLDPDYQKYAFIRDERGRIYEVLTWKPGRGVSSDAVREHFSALGFAGNTAAFISWVVKNHPEGWYASIPEDDQCFVDGGVLQAPRFYRDGSNRKLRLLRLAGDWGDDYVFVAFREIPQ